MPLSRTSLSKTVDLVRKGSAFLVTCHVRPDADALGSAMGWAAILQSLGKRAVLYSHRGVPPHLQFLKGWEQVQATIPDGPFDGVFVMDAAAQELVPPLPPCDCGPVILVDHHSAHDDYGDLVLRETSSAATAEVVVKLARALGVRALPVEACEPLYAALVADTGGFRYASTSAGTMALGSELLAAGVDPWKVASHLFERWSPARMRLLGRVLAGMSLERDGQIAIMTVSADQLAAVSADEDALEGMVNYGRMLDGVRVALMLYETEGHDIKVSLRAGDSDDVTDVAKALGGGGHRSAAGALLPNTTLAAARARALEAIDQHLRSVPQPAHDIKRLVRVR